MYLTLTRLLRVRQHESTQVSQILRIGKEIDEKTLYMIARDSQSRHRPQRTNKLSSKSKVSRLATQSKTTYLSVRQRKRIVRQRRNERDIASWSRHGTWPSTASSPKKQSSTALAWPKQQWINRHSSLTRFSRSFSDVSASWELTRQQYPSGTGTHLAKNTKKMSWRIWDSKPWRKG